MIINATNIGRKLAGIGRYSFSVSSYFLTAWDYPFQLMINEDALPFFDKERNRDKITVVNRAISPDLGFRGHLLRLLWINRLGLQKPGELIFNTSQLEGCLFHRKQIITVHDLIPLIYRRHFKKQYFYFKYMLPMILRNSAGIVTGSQHTKHLIMKFYKIPEQRIHVILYGINDFFLNQTPQHKKRSYILYVGRLSPTKNIAGLVEAFERLINKHSLGLRLKMTGDEKKLCCGINKGIKDKIEFVGYPDDDYLAELYRNASLLVFPSFYEGFGFPALEAMACGCPVVVSNVASLPEVCGDAAYYVDPYNIESIAEGIHKVLTDKALRQSLIEKGLERAKLFSWEKSAKKHIEVFEEVLSS